MENPRDYYKSDATMSTAGERAAELRALPNDLATQCEIVQGVLVHRDIAPWLYDLKLTEAQRDDGHTRPLAKMLDRIHALDDRPLTIARDPAHRMPTVCRHFSLMLSGILHEQGFRPGRDAASALTSTPASSKTIGSRVLERAAVALDSGRRANGRDPAQGAQRQVQHRSMCRAINSSSRETRGSSVAPGAPTRRISASPTSKNPGLWFIAGNVVRDFASLNRMEALPWDVWGMMEIGDASLTDGRKALLDRVAALTLAGDEALPEIRELYESDERLRMPPVVFNAAPQRT